jgi:ribonucleoside-diphosphate reductase beta chain
MSEQAEFSLSNVFKPRKSFKPLEYPWAFDAYRLQNKMHWNPEESPMHADVKCWNKKLSAKEKNLLTQIFRFFVQGDCDVADGYIERYLPVFKKPELRMMMGSFVNMEATHIDAYSLLMETIGMHDSEYQAFLEYKEMADKHNFISHPDFEIPDMQEITDVANEIEDKADREDFLCKMQQTFVYQVAKNIAVYSAFTEGLQLFSSFAILMNFQRSGKMTGMCTIVEWSIKDETLHVESMLKLFNIIVDENPWVFNPAFKESIKAVCMKMVDLEDKFIDLAYQEGGTDDLNKEDVHKYIRFVANMRMKAMRMDPVYDDVSENPLPWMEEITNSVVHTNFFEQKSTSYSKASMTGSWSDVWGKYRGRSVVSPE